MDELGGSVQRLQDKRASFCNTDLRYLDHLVPAALVPCRRSSIKARRFNERLIALGIIGVDGLPRRKEEHLPMVRIRRQERLQLIFRQRADLVQHAHRVHDTTLEEDEASLKRVLFVLLDVQAENGVGELPWWQPGTQRLTFASLDDGSGAIAYHRITAQLQGVQQSCFATARTAGKDDALCWHGGLRAV